MVFFSENTLKLAVNKYLIIGVFQFSARTILARRLDGKNLLSSFGPAKASTWVRSLELIFFSHGEKIRGAFIKFERQLEDFMELQPLERMREELAAVKTVLDGLREMVGENGFGSQAEEIDFFKQVKPRFYMLMVLSAERWAFPIKS